MVEIRTGGRGFFFAIVLSVMVGRSSGFAPSLAVRAKLAGASSVACSMTSHPARSFERRASEGLGAAAGLRRR